MSNNPRDLLGLMREMRRDITALQRRRQGGGGGGGSLPPGVVMEYDGDPGAVPASWLVCDGSLVLITDYPDLYASIGTRHNVGGEPSTHFRLPNRKGRVSVGLDSAQTEFNAIGKTGGAKTHTLTEAEMPPHSHDLSSTGAGHSMSWGQGNISFSTNPQAQALPPGGNGLGTWQNEWNYTQSKGGGNAHNNLQPYVVTTFIIKT